MHKQQNNNPFDVRDVIYTAKMDGHALFDPNKLLKLKSQQRAHLPNDNYYELKLSSLEQFVDTLLNHDEAPFVLDTQDRYKTHYQPASHLADYFSLVPDFIRVVKALSVRYEYSEHINVFITCARSLGLLDAELDWKNEYLDAHKMDPRFGGKPAAILFNDLVGAIRNTWKTKNIQAKVNSRRYEANERRKGYCQYVKALFNHYARLVVVRIDLFYQKNLTGNKSAADITKDLKHLIENKRNNSLFDHMTGYIAKLENGEEKGMHWHILFFFDGSKRCNTSHSYLAESIGEYWKNNVTQGQGDYWNVNARANDYKCKGLLGIGTINYNDQFLRNKLNYIVSYLCKTDQYFKPKFSPKVRLFRRGNYPKVPDKKRSGRPRGKQETQTIQDSSIENE